MIRLRDHYFVAWLNVVKKYKVYYKENGIYIDINKTEYDEALLEYKQTLKPILKEIRSVVKELSRFSSNSSNPRRKQ